jgi:hypothetical protein
VGADFRPHAGGAVGPIATIRPRRASIGGVAIAAAWFPDLDRPDGGVLGRLGSGGRAAIARDVAALFKRGSALVERLGLGGRGDAPASTGGRMGEAEPMLDTLDPHPGAV